jgi:nucleoside-diphosphate-sugar epimerase
MRCAVTGSTGYVGSRVSAYFSSRGWTMFEFARHSHPQSIPGCVHVPFQLESRVDPAVFRNNRIRMLIHCAYDFRSVKWKDIHRINVDGSVALMRAANEAGVDKIIFVSSISAFEGCNSLYGKAKLETEKAAASMGAHVIRPGLVFGSHLSTGMFGSLQRAAAKSSLIPLIGSGKYKQYLIHEEDVCELLLRIGCGELALSAVPVVAASAQGWQIRDLLQVLAAPHHSKITFLPLPWRAIWIGLKLSELLGIPAPFKSDNLISLVRQNPSPDFLTAAQIGFNFREFSSSFVAASSVGSPGPSSGVILESTEQDRGRAMGKSK